jgi:nucleoside 2-deoxyribosyltransferase
MIVYMAHAIDTVGPETKARIDIVSKGAADALRIHTKHSGGMAVFSPYFAWCRGYNEEVSEVNRSIIHKCDFLIAILTPECFGTIREIEYAQTVAEIPVVVVTDSASQLTQHIESTGLLITQMESVLSHPRPWANEVMKEVRKINGD